MIDTIGLTCQVGAPVETMALESLGWTIHTVSNAADGLSVFATVQCQGDGDARLRYFADAGQIALEVSLPRLVKGDNALLLSWPDCVSGMVRAAELASDTMHMPMPAIENWQVFRLDPVWAWPVDPTPYLSALHFGRLRGTQVAQEPGSVRWRSLRSGSIFARFYDKSHEQGRAVGLPARFERQIRPKKQVVRVDGQELGRTVSDLNESAMLSILRDGVAQVGLDQPVRTVAATKAVLIDALGKRAGRNLYRVLLESREVGGLPVDLAAATRRKYERQMRQAGVGMVSLETELPPLQVAG